MNPTGFQNLLQWIESEYLNNGSIFQIHKSNFYKYRGKQNSTVLDKSLDLPLGPAAGPHTQLAQNIICSYLCGGRFFELKTVQKMDNLDIPRPCIAVPDEGYNVEWSQELKIEESFDEYLKAWVLIHLLKNLFNLSDSADEGFIFNMSVGYDLAGIKTERMDWFIENLKSAKQNKKFTEYREILYDFCTTTKLIKSEVKRQKILNFIPDISSSVSDSVTLSTMHGCPPQEIEAICIYLLKEKKLHTYVKLNPTVCGFDAVHDILSKLGYGYMKLNRDSFQKDIQFDDAVGMIQRLQQHANENQRTFGIKLSNTLETINKSKILPGDEMYMSGRPLFPVVINLAYNIARKLNGKINISFSGGASNYNIRDILKCGIFPVTLVTDLLKPGGYLRLKQMAVSVDQIKFESSGINLNILKSLSAKVVSDPTYHKANKYNIHSIKSSAQLPLFDCFMAPCREACAIHQDVSQYISLIEKGKHKEAFEIIIRDNPLPHITSYICDHLCIEHCTRCDYEDPVLIRDLKKDAAEKGFEKFKSETDKHQKTVPASYPKVAVIGAGPSGLSSAYFLARSGFDVTVYEKEKNAGGVVRNIIPYFRLPPEAIEKDIELVRMQGVRFRFNTTPYLSVNNLKTMCYKYIYIATGAEISQPLELNSSDQPVLNALDFLREFSIGYNKSIGKTVAVIGGGNSAMDGARAALRCPGVKNVYIIYRRTLELMPADKEEYDSAIKDGVIFKDLLQPVEFQNHILTCQKMKLGKAGPDGRRLPVPDQKIIEEFEIDTLISAIGEKADIDFFAKNNLNLDEFGKVIVNPETYETSEENVFIGGDVRRGPSTVVESIADGKKVAQIIAQKEGLKIFQSETRYADLHRFHDIYKKKGTVETANLTDSKMESKRCLECDVVCNKCVDVCPNRANIAIPVQNEIFQNAFQIIHLDYLCNDCGNCETFCPYQGKPHKDKFTVFLTKPDLAQSSNQGFFMSGDKKHVLFRNNGSIQKINLNHKSKRYSLVNERELETKMKEIIESVLNKYSYLI